MMNGPPHPQSSDLPFGEGRVALPLEPHQWEAISRRLTANNDLGYGYPWDGLESVIASSPVSRLELVGYGSLLHPDAARRAFRDVPDEGHPPVVAFGARRVFNYSATGRVLEGYGVAGAAAGATLNTEFTGSAADVFNGRLASVDPADLDALRERERGYDLVPVVWLPWGDLAAAPRVAFALSAGSATIDGRGRVDGGLLPHPGYLELCREGALRVSEAFEAMFLDTTYLGDRATRLRDYVERG